MAALNVCEKSLKEGDVFCHICLGILIEPVTAPCQHVYCLTCFEKSMNETSYLCPFCRKRMSNWVRTATKTDTLVNTKLWETIKLEYRSEVQSKLSGLDDGLDKRLQEQNRFNHIITPEGVVGEEYAKVQKSYEEELKKQRDKEEQKSLELIRQIKKEDKAEKLRKEKASLDFIRQLRSSVGRPEKSMSQKKVAPSTSSSSSANKLHRVTVGPMDQHIKRLSLEEQADVRCPSSGSGDSIGSELHHFKPIRNVPKTPPKDGSANEYTVRKVTPVKLLFTVSTPETKIGDNYRSIYSSFSAFRRRPGAPDLEETPKKKAKLYVNEVPESGVLKEINFDENSDSNGKPDDVKTDEWIPKFCALLGEENREEQQRLEERLLQEKADRELAMRLSREWEQTYELRTARLPRTCLMGARQTTLLDTVVRRRKK